ncbi:unnamed protein product [Closterium sp. Yama58-4]|nr:unnamed protein product [Closterium sp. Yama58-4]
MQQQAMELFSAFHPLAQLTLTFPLPSPVCFPPAPLPPALSTFPARAQTHLRMDGAMQQQAMELFSACYALLAPSLASFGAPESPDDSERAWSACVLFVVRKLGPAKAAEEAAARAGQIVPPGSSRSQWPWFTLSELLRATKLTVVDFFKEIANFLPRVSPVMQAAYGDLWEQRLEVKELQANFVHAIVLFNHYKKVFAELFISSPPPSLPSGAPPPAAAAAAASQFSREMRFGWLLFLSIKAHLLRRFPDLVTATNAMLCTLVVLIVHVPPSLRRFSFSDPVRFSRRAGRERLVDVVGSLCASYKAAEGEVSALLERTQQLMARCLARQASLATCEQHDAGEVCPDRLFLFEGLLQDAAALPSVDLVEGAYQEAYVEAGDRALDERMFLLGDGQVIGAVSQLTAATSVGAAKVSGTDCVDLVEGAYQEAYVEVGDRALDERMFLSGDGQVIGAVSQLTATTSVGAAKRYQLPSVDLVEGAYQEAYVEAGDRALDERMFLSGDGQVIGAVSQLTAATSVAAAKNLTPLLDNDRFHRALLACSAELVLASHKATAHTFPAVLAPAGVSAFDMDKVMEGFVRYEEGLPGELKRHLNACDERILESLAWEKGSSLYVTVVAARRHLLAEVKRLQLLPEGEEGLVGKLVGRGAGGKGSGGDGEKGDGTPEKENDEGEWFVLTPPLHPAHASQQPPHQPMPPSPNSRP